MSFMVRITVDEFRQQIDEWLRRAEEEPVEATRAGEAVVRLIPADPSKRTFANRRLLPEFEAMQPVAGDSTEYISEDRDRT